MLNYFSSLVYKLPSLIDCDPEIDNFISSNLGKSFNTLDYRINASEISKAISKLKRGKSGGLDQILNEMLQAGHSQLLPVLVKLFNLILSLGHFPDLWHSNSVPARLGKGQGAKEIGHNLACERPKFGHNLVCKRHKIFYP